MDVYMYVCIAICAYICTYIRTYVRMYTCMYIRTYIRMCVCMYVCMYGYIHIYCIFAWVRSNGKVWANTAHLAINKSVQHRLLITSPHYVYQLLPSPLRSSRHAACHFIQGHRNRSGLSGYGRTTF